MIRTPRQAIFDKVYILSKEVTPSTYDYLPSAEAKYPFIHISSGNDDLASNNDFFGSFTQIINIWATREQRRQLDELYIKLHDKLMTNRQSFEYYTNIKELSTQLIEDNTTGTALLHLVVTAVFNYSKRG